MTIKAQESPLEEPKPRRTCNKHADCDAADREAQARGMKAACHCHIEDCEDCFGC